jgi:hypothetical protein
MAGKEELEITIAPDGAVQVHVKGIKGKGCLEIKKCVENAVGYVSEQKFTSEYYEQEDQAQVRRSL